MTTPFSSAPFNFDSAEIQKIFGYIRRVERSALYDRQQGRTLYTQLLRDTDRLGRETRCLLRGDYGYGAALMVWRAIASCRNEPAALSRVLAPLATGCPPRWAAQAWHTLTGDEQTAADKTISEAIAFGREQGWDR